MTRMSVKRALRIPIDYDALLHVERLAENIKQKVSCLRVLERSRVSDARHKESVEPYVVALSDSLSRDLEHMK
jgi:hypothetical protein